MTSSSLPPDDVHASASRSFDILDQLLTEEVRAADYRPPRQMKEGFVDIESEKLEESVLKQAARQKSQPEAKIVMEERVK